MLEEIESAISCSLQKLYVLFTVFLAVSLVWIVLSRAERVQGIILTQGSSCTEATCPVFEETQPVLEARERLAATWVNVAGQDFIYTVGGRDTSRRVTDTLFFAKLLSNGHIEGWQTKGNAFDGKVFQYHTLVSTGGKLYLLGGTEGGLQALDLVYWAQPQPGTGITEWITTTPLSISVYLHAAVPLGNKIYVIGGHLHNYSFTSDVFSSQVLTDGELSYWNPENSLYDLARDGITAHAAVASEKHQCIYVVGGWLGPYDSGPPHNKVFRACVEASGDLGPWTTETEALPLIPADAIGIYYHSAAIVNDRVFVIGGTISATRSISSSDSVYIGTIKPNGHLGNWVVCEHCLPRNLERQAMAVAGNGMLYAIAGATYVPSGTARIPESVYDAVAFTPLLAFEKMANSKAHVTRGDSITYTLLLTNLGVRALGELAITDTVEAAEALEFYNLPEDECQVYRGASNTITCTISELGLTDTRRLDFRVTIPRPPSTSLSILNSPRLTSDKKNTFFGKHYISQDLFSNRLAPNCDADLRLQKKSYKDLVIAGQGLSYTLFIHNNGPSPAQDVVVIDDLPDGITFKSANPTPSTTSPLMWSLSDISVGESLEIYLTVQVDSNASGTLTNTALVDSATPDFSPGNNHDEDWTIVVSEADLAINKTGYTNPITPGHTLTYTLVVSNQGPSDAHNVTVLDFLPSQLEIITTTPPAINNSDTAEWQITDLPANHSQEIQITATVTLTSAGVIRNVAVVLAEIDTCLQNNVAEEQTAVGSLADLGVEKAGAPDIVNAGTTITYTLIITNWGPSIATNVVLTDTLPVSVCKLHYQPPQCNGDPLVCELDSILAGEDKSLQLVGQVCSNSTGTLMNKVEVNSDVPDSNPQNNSQQVSTPIDEAADLFIEKSRNPALIIAGNILTYTLRIGNNGPSDASGVIISDSLHTSMHFVTATHPVTVDSGIVTWYMSTLLSGQSEELELVVRVDSRSDGVLTNTASVTSYTPDGRLANNLIQDQAKIYALADLRVEKDSSLKNVVGGETLLYTLQIINNGPSDARNVVVEDKLPPDVTLVSCVPTVTQSIDSLIWQTDTLAATEIWTIEIVAEVNANASGILANEANAYSDVFDPDWANNDGQVQVLAPVRVSNTAYVCEDGLWCKKSNTVTNPQFTIYLPIICKASYTS